MIQLTPISISATAQQYNVRIAETLCQSICLNDSIQPQYDVTFSVGNINVNNGTAFVTINAVGSILYVPKGCCNCNSRRDMFSESFEVAFVGTGTPTIALTTDGQVGNPTNVECCKANKYAISTNLTITATFYDSSGTDITDIYMSELSVDNWKFYIDGVEIENGDLITILGQITPNKIKVKFANDMNYLTKILVMQCTVGDIVGKLSLEITNL